MERNNKSKVKKDGKRNKKKEKRSRREKKKGWKEKQEKGEKKQKRKDEKRKNQIKLHNFYFGGMKMVLTSSSKLDTTYIHSGTRFPSLHFRPVRNHCEDIKEVDTVK